jgi:hypothetical protein
VTLLGLSVKITGWAPGQPAHDREATQVGIVTTSSETAFTWSPEIIYDFVTNPADWTKTYPGSAHITNVPDELPLQVGDTRKESGEDDDQIFTWHLAIAMRPRLWMFNSVGLPGAKIWPSAASSAGREDVDTVRKSVALRATSVKFGYGANLDLRRRHLDAAADPCGHG